MYAYYNQEMPNKVGSVTAVNQLAGCLTTEGHIRKDNLRHVGSDTDNLKTKY